MKKHILFVDEKSALFDSFRQECAASGSDWEADFARNSAEARIRISDSDYHAVVADIQLPDTSGIDLLDEIMRLQPQAVRMVLSDLSDPTNTLHCVGRAHRHLLKPCEASTLLEALKQALALETWLPGAAVQKLMPQMRWLPSPPSIYFNLLQEMRSPNASVDRIGQLIAQDPAVSAKVLQLANSAVFGLQLQVVQPEEAVAYIGLETTMALVLLAHSFSSFEPLRPSLFSAEELWRHSLATGQFARAIAVAENHGGEISAQAFAAGLLHDIGKLLFAANLPQPYAKAVALARDERIPVSQAEKRILGADHAEAGGALLGIWGLPSPVVEAVALHHAPVVTTSQGFTPLTAVHTANFIEHESRANESGVEPALAWDYLAALGLDDRAEEWRRICMEPAIG